MRDYYVPDSKYGWMDSICGLIRKRIMQNTLMKRNGHPNLTGLQIPLN